MAQGPINDPPQGPTQTETIAIVLCLFWVIGVALFFWVAPDDPALGRLRYVLLVLALCVPVATVWVALAAARSARMMRADIYRLRAALDALRKQVAAGQADRPAPQRQVAAVSVQPSVTVRPLPKSVAAARNLTVEQPRLALGALPDDDSPPIDRPDLIRALNFPDSEDDTEGFAALRRALRDRGARHLVQASQDVLTLLSQDGIYMDDLRPDPPDAALWRRFAKGERGHSMQAVGAVREEAALSVVTARMREDAVFRDAVHHFLRRFDLVLVGFEDQADDTDLLAMAETRTARAFMLLARASRTFD